MKEHGILMSAPMVRALLEGKKTQTRRVVKPQPPYQISHLECGMYAPVVVGRDGEEQPGAEIFGAYDLDGEWGLRCPYGGVGDRLWVRETWRRGEGGRVFFRADSHEVLTPWRPGIHLRRVDARITLEVTEVRVQRLQAISEDDARAEGVTLDPGIYLACRLGPYGLCFARLWNGINGPGSWDANPWVWAISFKRVDAAQERAA